MPIYADGALWLYADGIFRAMSLDQLMVRIGESTSGEKNCKKASDYRAVAEHCQRISSYPSFFDNPPVGVATQQVFLRIGADGTTREPLTPAHAVRFALDAEPDKSQPAPQLERFLASAFGGPGGEDELRRFQEAAGGVLTRGIPSLQKALLLYGPAASSKSTAASLIVGLLPPESVCATSPHHWDREYYVAHLAGKVLNVVGELSDTSPLPAAAFKSVLGQDRLQGRHPNHRPIEFVNSAAHLFVSNHLPRTEDRSDGFFRRWEIIHFPNQIAREDMVPDLAGQILRTELAALLAFAIEGAERLARNGRFTPSAAHDRLMLKWRLSASSVLEFLHDEHACQLEPKAAIAQADLFAAYRKWAEAAGRRAIGRNTFYDELDQSGGVAGVRRVRNNGVDIVRGVQILGGWGG